MQINIITKSGTYRQTYTVPKYLSEILLDCGIDFDMPCGGKRKCRKCRVKATGTLSPYCADEHRFLTQDEKKAGIRYACMAKAYGDAEIDLSGYQYDENMLDTLTLPPVRLNPTSRKLGVAIDIGTTTLAGALFDLKDGTLLEKRTAANPQRKYGSDVLSRLEASAKGKTDELAQCTAKALSTFISFFHNHREIDSVVLSGNTAMLYLLCGHTPSALLKPPFHMEHAYGETIENRFGLPIQPNAAVLLSACISAFVGGDILCGMLASNLGNNTLLLDLGTNGEIVLGCHDMYFCCSASAGPAFEGAGITFGMPAKKGAVCNFTFANRQIMYSTIGETEPIGICGSGLIDLIALLLKFGVIDRYGTINSGCPDFQDCIFRETNQLAFRIPDTDLYLTQEDIRNIQLAKSAVFTSVQQLIQHAGIPENSIEKLIVSGGFGSYLRMDNSAYIGLIPKPLAKKAEIAGNTALTGAAMMLLDKDNIQKAQMLRSRTKTVLVNAEKDFQTQFIRNLNFMS